MSSLAISLVCLPGYHWTDCLSDVSSKFIKGSLLLLCSRIFTPNCSVLVGPGMDSSDYSIQAELLIPQSN